MAVTSAVATTDVPRLATDVELIGRFEDSGFKEAPYLARRKDGQVVQLPAVLYALAEEVDGRRDTAQIARALSRRIRRGVDAEMVELLLEGQLRRLGLVAQRNGVTAEVVKLDPLLALRFRARVVPAGVVRALTTVLQPLFWPPVMVAAVVAFVAVDAWLFGVHGISQGLRHVLYQPSLLLALVGGVVVATAFHELGHATAVRYGGAEPGVMGVGVYIVWPAFYTDITDAYRLGKWGRLRADVGGMYFNALVALGAAAAFALTRFEPLLLLVVLQTFAIVQQSLPFLRLDGYYIVSDLTGVPDILGRLRPVLGSLLPWRSPDARVTELKPWVRGVVTGYLVVIVPVIALVFVLMLVHAPRAFATA
jgi:putative peptide zinc metalloprotease protein